MHECDVNEPSEEQAGLPIPNRTNSRNNSNTPTGNVEKQQQGQEIGTFVNCNAESAALVENFIIVLDSDEENQEANATVAAQSVIYPLVEQYIDQLPAAETAADEVEAADGAADRAEASKRKRQRRVYVAENSRCASLRSRQASQGSATESAQIESPKRSQQQPSPTLTEPEEPNYIRPELFKAEFWNSIDEYNNECETKASGRKRRADNGGRKRRRANNQLPPVAESCYSPDTAAAIAAAELEFGAGAGAGAGAVKPASVVLHNISPETAAAIWAAQLELDSSKPATRASRKRTCTMSLYDRRYQTNDERRVGNGYNAGNAMRAVPAGDADAQEMQGHQYYGPVGGGSNGTGLNGNAPALNHAPAMGTLCNIGNTCYLNSVVYTLRFAPHFLHNLHHLIHDLNVVQQTILRQHSARSASLGRGASGGGGGAGAHLEHARSWSSKDLATNAELLLSNSNGIASSSSSCSSGSSKSSHQAATEKLHELYHSLHGNEMADSTEPYHADTLLHAIQDVNATFEGNQQQDAHEFLMCVLNCIRETNQSLIKAIGECPDVIAQGYIANPDETDAADGGQERGEGGLGHMLGSAGGGGGNGALATSQSATTATSTKTSFFSRKSKRKDEVKASKNTRLQSPLKDNISPTAGTLTAAPHITSNSLFYLNTVDLSGAGAGAASHAPPLPPPPSAAGARPAKYCSDDEPNAASLLKDKMRVEERIRELNLNFFSADFEGIVVLTTKCLSCETVTRQKQGMLDISVPVPITGYDNADFNDKPSAYIQNSCITREYFRGENKYSCNQCTGYTEAIRSISYEVLPRLLVIQLNRFSGGMEKVSTYVPTTFTLQCFCAKCCELSEGNKLHVYKLYSVITHVGATLTVGHYIAYTCFLDLASDYVNCPKDRRNQASQQQQQQPPQPASENMAANNGASSSSSSTPVSAAASALASSGTSLIKKMKFGRSKASSSGDMSKNVKQLNGINSKSITNGIGKLSMNTTCHGVSCCAMRLCCGQQQQSHTAAGSNSSSDFSEESLQNGTNSSSYPTGYGSTGRGGIKAASYATPTTEPIWYMCDDDKIKAMTQREFEELLSPTRKITITPYLLFYARFDLQSPAAAAARESTTSTPPPPPAPQSSWSNDNLHGGLHKM